MNITEYSVENEIPTVHCFSRDENRKRVLTKDDSFRPYFYVLTEEAHKFKNDDRVLDIIDTDITDLNRVPRKVSKIVCKIPKYVSELRNEVSEHFEADILYPTRYTIDNFDEIPGVPLSVVYIDIETNSEKAFPNTQRAQDEITSLTVFNNIKKAYQVYD